LRGRRGGRKIIHQNTTLFSNNPKERSGQLLLTDRFGEKRDGFVTRGGGKGRHPRRGNLLQARQGRRLPTGNDKTSVKKEERREFLFKNGESEGREQPTWTVEKKKDQNRKGGFNRGKRKLRKKKREGPFYPFLSPRNGGGGGDSLLHLREWNNLR